MVGSHRPGKDDRDQIRCTKPYILTVFGEAALKCRLAFKRQAALFPATRPLTKGSGRVGASRERMPRF